VSPANGTLVARGDFGRYSEPVGCIPILALSWGFGVGAGEGNRTLMTSLEDR
jgi:hypothetical protein